MGLDMYLTGRKFLWPDWQNPENNRTEDGIEVEEVRLKLGYWRKHPDLHGFIVQTFAGGLDECQEIPLNTECLRQIREAVEQKKLPKTTGFFFGDSTHWADPESMQQTLTMLTKAEEWLGGGDSKKEFRSVIYRASW